MSYYGYYTFGVVPVVVFICCVVGCCSGRKRPRSTREVHTTIFTTTNGQLMYMNPVDYSQQMPPVGSGEQRYPVYHNQQMSPDGSGNQRDQVYHHQQMSPDGSGEQRYPVYHNQQMSPDGSGEQRYPVYHNQQMSPDGSGDQRYPVYHNQQMSPVVSTELETRQLNTPPPSYFECTGIDRSTYVQAPHRLSK